MSRESCPWVDASLPSRARPELRVCDDPSVSDWVAEARSSTTDIPRSPPTMSYAKYAKYAIIGLAPLVLIIGVWSSLNSGGGKFPDSYMFVDIQTGELVTLRRSEIKSIPEKNSRDGTFTLFPVSLNPEGKYQIEERYQEGLRSLAETQDLKIDTETFEVPAN